MRTAELYMALLFLLPGLLGSGCQKQTVYTITEARYRLLKNTEYLDELHRALGSYPLEEARLVSAQEVYLLPEKYQNPRRLHSIELGQIYPEDLTFEPDKKTQIQYLSNGKWFLLFSHGPDGPYEQQVISEIHRDKMKITENELNMKIYGMMYDPTNGTGTSSGHYSRGDLIFGSWDLSFMGHERDGSVPARYIESVSVK